MHSQQSSIVNQQSSIFLSPNQTYPFCQVDPHQKHDLPLASAGYNQ
jgi:hypothetical protein